MGAGKTIGRQTHAVSVSRERTPAGLQSALSDHLGSNASWGDAFGAALGGGLAHPEMTNEQLEDTLEQYADKDGYGAKPDPAAFVSPDIGWDIESYITQTDSPEETTTREANEDLLTEMLLEEVGAGATYFEAMAAASRITQDENLIHDVLVKWDAQMPNEWDEDLEEGPDPDFDYQAYYERD